MNLFNHAVQFKALQDIMDNDVEFDDETGEITDNSQVIADLFAELELGLGDKLNNSQYYIIDTLSDAETLKAEAKRLNERAKVLTNKANRVKELMKNAMIATGDTKLKTNLFNFSIRTSKSVQVSDVEELPREYVRLKREADKALIKKALADGEEIPGCAMVENKSLSAR